MGDQIGGMVWCSSGIIFSPCYDGGLWLDQVKWVPFSLILAHLEAGNHHHQVIQLEPLEVWHHRGIGVGYGLCSVYTCTSYTHYNVIYIFCHIMDYISLCGWNLGYCFWWIIRCNIYKIWWIDTFCNEPSKLYGDGRIWVVTVLLHNLIHMFLHLQVAYMAFLSLVKINFNNHLLFHCFVYIYTVVVVILHCGGNITSFISMS